MSSQSRRRKNVYSHEVELLDLKIRNQPPEEFRVALERIPYRGYRVERLADGREIIITKPGGKFSYGALRREDFMVWIFTPRTRGMWLISHKDIYEDLLLKSKQDPPAALRIIDALERTCSGEEPDDLIGEGLANPCGETPELILKAYKWMWGQEDCNYPPPNEGRHMSMKAIRELALRLK